MEKIYNLALEAVEHLNALESSIETAERADRVKSILSQMVDEAKHLHTAFALAVASAPKSDATSPAPMPADNATTDTPAAAPVLALPPGRVLAFKKMFPSR